MTEIRQIKFQIEVVSRTGQKSVRLEGRCCGDEIRVGDSFSTIFEQEWERDEEGTPHLNLSHPQDLDVQVVAIRSMRPDALGTGEVGVLTVRTEAPDSLCPNRMLEAAI